MKTKMTVRDLMKVLRDLDPDMPVRVGLNDLREDQVFEDVHGRSTAHGFVHEPVLCIQTDD